MQYSKRLQPLNIPHLAASLFLWEERMRECHYDLMEIVDVSVETGNPPVILINSKHATFPGKLRMELVCRPDDGRIDGIIPIADMANFAGVSQETVITLIKNRLGESIDFDALLPEQHDLVFGCFLMTSNSGYEGCSFERIAIQVMFLVLENLTSDDHRMFKSLIGILDWIRQLDESEGVRYLRTLV